MTSPVVLSRTIPAQHAQRPAVDLTINGRGIYAIQSLSAQGRRWLIDNVPDRFDDELAYSDDTRCTQDIAEGATNDGQVVAVNGYLYLAGGARGEAVNQ
jgi:hypothetical protein